jgi:Prokaryotic Cytochrome C oxidase subunit IV
VRRFRDAPARVAVTWLVLLAATLLSWESAHSSGDYRLLSTVVLLIAFLKARLIGLEFMELRAAPRVLRCLFEAWTVIACAALLTLYLLSPAAPPFRGEQIGGRPGLGAPALSLLWPPVAERGK